MGRAHGAESADELRPRREPWADRGAAAGRAAHDQLPSLMSSIASWVEITPPNAWRKMDRVALCSASLREALASEIMIVLKLRIAASRAVHSQHTFVTVPTISVMSMPRERSNISNLRDGSANGVRRFFDTRRSSG